MLKTFQVILLFTTLVPFSGSAQRIEYAVKVGVNGSYLVQDTDLYQRWGSPSGDRYDPALGFLLTSRLRNSMFFVGVEPTLAMMGSGPTNSLPFGSENRQFKASMLFLSFPAFIGFKLDNRKLNPYLSIGAGPQFLLRSTRTEADPSGVNADVIEAIDSFKTTTFAGYFDAGMSFGKKLPIEFGLQWNRSITYGYVDRGLYGFGGLRVTSAQVYTRFRL